jgi:hypothetical protein
MILGVQSKVRMTGVAWFSPWQGQNVDVMVASDDVAEQEYRQERPVIGCDGVLTDTLRSKGMLP